MKKLATILLCTTLLSGCSLAPDYQRPEISPEVPAVAEGAATDWWSGFNNPELGTLVHQSLVANNDVSAALHRIDEARASAKIAGASLLPDVSASGGIGHTESNPSHGPTIRNDSYNAGLAVNYELDLWGKNRSNVSAAKQEVEASQYDHQAVSLIASADTAVSFITLLSLDDRVDVAQQNLDNALDVMRIVQTRFNAGTLSALEVAQQKNSLANSQAAIASLQQQRTVALDQLAVLLGQPPQSFTVKSTSLNSMTPPEVALLQPSELLERRPDILRAEAQLKAANYDIGAARAQYFPSINIGANTALAALPFSAPATLASGVAASVAAPIFSGGAIEGGVERAKAIKGEQADAYRKTVLTAFQEVQDALAEVQHTGERMQHLTVAEEQARTAYNFARQRFDAGTIDFIDLLDTQRTLLQAQDALYQEKANRLAATVDLYRAMGGSWAAKTAN